MGVASDASDPWRKRVCLPDHAHLLDAAWLTLDEQAVFEFLSSVIVDLCSRWTRHVRNVAQQLTLDEQLRKAQPGNISQAMTEYNANARASETPEQTLNRRETDKVRKTRKRASEQTLNRMLVQCL